MSTMYKIHRRIDAPIELGGLKGQYILYAGGCVIANMLLFAILYIAGVNNWICLLLCFGSGGVGIGMTHRYSRHYGPHGWHKRRLAARIPKALRAYSRRPYLELKK